MKAIDTKPQKIKDLFSRYEFVIPEFQRPYSWTDTKQCQALWDDLTDFYASEPHSDASWFLGSIVLSKTSSMDSSLTNDSVRYVVDGQQRLTTIFILLAAVKSKFNEYYGLRDVLSPRDEATGTTKGVRIQTRVPEDTQYAIMLDRFACDDDSFCEERLAKSVFARNYMFFKNKLKEWIQKVESKNKDADEYKNRFISFLLNRVELLCIECEDEEDAFRLFEVVNDRGMELSAVQIIKPRLMQCLDADEKKDFLEDWGRWTDADETKEDNNPLISFLFQTLKEIRSVKTEGHPDYQKKTLSDFFKHEMLKNVQTDINTLFAIHKWNPPDELFILMVILEQITSKTYKVPLYSYLSSLGKVNAKTGNFSLNAKDVKKVLRFSRDLVRFLYGLSIVDKTSRDDIRKPCYDQVKWVFDKKATYKLRLEKSTLKEVKRRLEDHFEEVDCYKRGYLTGMILLASYLYAKKGKGRIESLAKLLRNGFEREHICPKKSGYAWARDWSVEIHSTLVNSIGNLIPLEKEINIDAKNNPFTVKRDGENGNGTFRDQKEAVGYNKSLSPEARDFLGKYGNSWTPEDVRNFAKKKCSLILKFLEAEPEGVR